MTIVSKASAYPKSVQSGLPRLAACPPGWTRGPLSAHLIEELRPLNMADDEVYDLVTVKRSRGGVVLRERLKGSQIAVKSQFRLKAGDFLISKRQIVHGACGIVPPELDGAIVSNEYSVLRARSTLRLDFLNCLAHSIYFQQTCFHSSIGVHVEKMIFKLGEWMKWDFNLPPLCEQQRIAEILSTWDRAIEAVEALIANARAQKGALTQLLLTGKRRLPEFEVSRGGNEEQGGSSSFPDGWQLATIGAIAGLVTSGSRGWAAYYSVSGSPFIRITNLRRLQITPDLSNLKFVRLPDSDNEGKRTRLRAGDILMSITADLGTIGYIDQDPTLESFISQHVALIRLGKRADTRFVAHQLAAPRHWNIIQKLNDSGAKAGLSLPSVRSIPVHLPSLPEQRRIAEVLSTRDQALDAMEAQLAALYQEKAGLMQQLLTGKRRVAAVESEAA